VQCNIQSDVFKYLTYLIKYDTTVWVNKEIYSFILIFKSKYIIRLVNC